MFKITKQAEHTVAYVTEFVADTEDDVKNLPTTNVAPGSVCIVTATSNVYMLNNQNTWVQL